VHMWVPFTKVAYINLIMEMKKLLICKYWFTPLFSIVSKNWNQSRSFGRILIAWRRSIVTMGKKLKKKAPQNKNTSQRNCDSGRDIGLYVEATLQIQNHLRTKMNKQKNYQVRICCPLVRHFSVHLKIMKVIVKQLNFLLWVKEKEIK